VRTVHQWGDHDLIGLINVLRSDRRTSLFRRSDEMASKGAEMTPVQAKQDRNRAREKEKPARGGLTS
jgi:hypothetical protein